MTQQTNENAVNFVAHVDKPYNMGVKFINATDASRKPAAYYHTRQFNGTSVSRDLEALVVTVEEKQDAHENNEYRTNKKITTDNSIKS